MHSIIFPEVDVPLSRHYLRQLSTIRAQSRRQDLGYCPSDNVEKLRCVTSSADDSSSDSRVAPRLNKYMRRAVQTGRITSLTRLERVKKKRPGPPCWISSVVSSCLVSSSTMATISAKGQSRTNENGALARLRLPRNKSLPCSPEQCVGGRPGLLPLLDNRVRGLRLCGGFVV